MGMARRAEQVVALREMTGAMVAVAEMATVVMMAVLAAITAMTEMEEMVAMGTAEQAHVHQELLFKGPLIIR
jgi:hypothetical protein